MNVLVLGGDTRYLEVIENLSCKYNVTLVGYKNTFVNNLVKNINIDDDTKGYSKYAVIIADIWIPHSNEKAKKAKEYFLNKFNNKFKNAIIKEVKKKNGPLTEKERYYILCYVEEL